MRKLVLIVLSLIVLVIPFRADALTNPLKTATKAEVVKILGTSEHFERFNDGEKVKTSDFLKAMFEIYDIEVSADDFFDPKMKKNPVMSYGAILNLSKTRNGQLSERLTYGKTQQILSRFLEIKDLLVHDEMYGKLNMHEHMISSGDPDTLLKIMGIFGMSKVFLMPTGVAPDNKYHDKYQAYLFKLQRRYPDKIMVWCTVDEADPLAAKEFETCVKTGGKGLKLIGGHPAFYDEPLNSGNMMRVYQVADKYNLPVIIHGSIVNIPAVKDELEDVYGSFPDVTFVQAHYGSVIMKKMDLELIEGFLVKYPNLYLDMSYGGGIQRHLRFYKQDPQKIHNFILKYQDRLMYGVDMIMSKNTELDYLYDRMKCDYDLHKSDRFYCEYASDPDEPQVGFALPRAVLKKIYYLNPKRILGM
ncbi:MAG: amidohydrolase family protein [Patescibacteria group bacterium]|nr:amidohydrolase [Patescibacteria group bacterium]